MNKVKKAVLSCLNRKNDWHRKWLESKNRLKCVSRFLRNFHVAISSLKTQTTWRICNQLIVFGSFSHKSVPKFGFLVIIISFAVGITNKLIAILYQYHSTRKVTVSTYYLLRYLPPYWITDNSVSCSHIPLTLLFIRFMKTYRCNLQYFPSASVLQSIQ